MRFDVSVVIPVKDGMPDVVDAVRSAIGQSHPPREIVLVDDGSADGGADQVERAFGERAGPRGEIRLRVLRGRFGSAGAARNAGWRAATGEWIAFLDADDLWFEGKLATAA
ncbi:MAG TPA: glycosyltransferase family 2 protein, partial [Candidatus Udaeobacter sp.]|nr:glycosyltransferase family 2 protein [Candidatus Udaeobacter sp.]